MPANWELMRLIVCLCVGESWQELLELLLLGTFCVRGLPIDFSFLKIFCLNHEGHTYPIFRHPSSCTPAHVFRFIVCLCSDGLMFSEGEAVKLRKMKLCCTHVVLSLKFLRAWDFSKLCQIYLYLLDFSWTSWRCKINESTSNRWNGVAVSLHSTGVTQMIRSVD